MNIPELLAQHNGTAFSFEVLPPIKGNGTESLDRTIERLREFCPQYINITTHRSEYIYTEVEGGLMQRSRIKRRPGTVAVAAAIQNKYGIPVVPHLLCSGFTKEEVEYLLLDLQFLGIGNILVLRGDKAKEDARFIPTEDGHEHATDLIKQINAFNEGNFMDGSEIKFITQDKTGGAGFSYGVACYPEKHEEALNLDTDFQFFAEKVALGADYAVTQLFYDNEAYFRFVERARKAGINVPIIPGIKPLRKLSQLTVIPKTFHCDFPEPLAQALLHCKTDAEVEQVGIEWSITQCRELMKAGAPSLHFYTVGATESIAQIAKAIY